MSDNNLGGENYPCHIVIIEEEVSPIGETSGRCRWKSERRMGLLRNHRGRVTPLLEKGETTPVRIDVAFVNKIGTFVNRAYQEKEAGVMKKIGGDQIARGQMGVMKERPAIRGPQEKDKYVLPVRERS